MSIKDFEKRLEFQGIVINRVPKPTRELFKAWAKEEFADDFGALLKFLLDNTLEYQRLKEMFFNSEMQVNLIQNKEEVEEDTPKRTNLAGQNIENKGGNKR